MSVKLIITTFALLCFLLGGEVSHASKAKSSELRVAGTIVAVENLYGHIYSSEDINSSFLIVRVDRVIKGHVTSPYILVNYKWRLKDKDNPFGQKADKWEFDLTSSNACSRTLHDLQFVEFELDGKTTGIMPRFRRTSSDEFELIPFDISLPCYESRYDSISRIATPNARLDELYASDITFFVLEKVRWINLAGTPLRISLIGHGDFEFTNTSKQGIAAYRFGCVDSNGSVLKKLDEKKVSIQPGNGITSSNSDGTSDQMEEIYICHQSEAKLSVVGVRFEDGSVWNAN